MSNEKFTPGPWEFLGFLPRFDSGDHFCNRGIVEAVNGMAVCKCFATTSDIDSHSDWAEAEANGALIAAAPEIYEALTGMCKLWEGVAKEIPALKNEQDYLNALSILRNQCKG